MVPPKGKNHFYEKFMHGLVGEDPHWESFNFSSKDNTTIPDSARKRMYADPTKSRAIIEQELEASFISLGGGELDPKSLVFDPVEPGDVGAIYMTSESVRQREAQTTDSNN